jgi:hypothetical protein
LVLKLQFEPLAPLLLIELGSLFVEPGSVGLDLLHHLVEIPLLFEQLVLLILQELFKVPAPLLQLLQLKLLLHDLLLPFGNLGLLLLEQLVVVLLLLFESFLAQPDVHQWQIYQVINRSPLVLLQIQHPANDPMQLLRVPGGNPVELAFLDLHRESHWILRLKRRVKRTQFVNDAPEGPDVALFIVLLIVNLLRRHVVRSADVGERELRFVVEHAGQAKVAELDIAVEI